MSIPVPERASASAAEAVAAPRLSIIIPAYNEESRLASTLDALLLFVGEREYSCEVIVVDDGSTDATSAICSEAAPRFPAFRLITGGPNRGKGYAVREGMLAASGEYMLMCDADLATPMDELDAFWPLVTAGADVVIASRPLRGSHLVKRQPIYREAAGRGLNLLIRAIATPGLHDTQCGFKLFSRSAVERIFPLCSIDGFSFDIEALYIARALGLRVVEAPVSWYHRPGSKVNLLRDGLRMLRDLFGIRLRHRGLRPASAMRDEEFDAIREQERSHWWYLGRRRLLRLLVDRLALTDARILDAGCGTGYAAEELRRGGVVVGLDAAEAALTGGDSGLNCVASVEAMPFADDSFDLVTSLDVIEHLDRDLPALREMRRVCKPGGYVFVTVPAYRFMWSTHDDALGHKRRYTAGELRRALRWSGFSICRVSYMVSTALPAAALFRLARRVIGGGDRAKSDLFSVPAGLNRFLASALYAEAALAWKVGLPFGLTVFALARKESA